MREIASVEENNFEKAMDNLFRLNLLSTSGALLLNPQLSEKFYSEAGNITVQFTRFG